MRTMGWVEKVGGLVLLGVLLAGCGGGAGTTSSDGGTVQPTSGEAVLSWQAPDAYEDGTPLTVAGYKIYYGTDPSALDQVVDVGNVLTASIGGLESGTWYFTVTAYDASAEESQFAEPASKLI